MASIQTRLIWLVLVVVLPFSALLVWYQIRDEQDAREAVYARMEAHATATAGRIGQHFAEYRGVMEYLAERPSVRALDPSQCDPLLTSLPEVNTQLFNLALRDADGLLLCSHLKTVPKKHLPQFQALFDAGLKASGFLVSEPIWGPTTQRWFSIVTVPVKNPQGLVKGVLVLSVDLQKLNDQVFAKLPNEVTVGAFDGSETLVLRSQDPEKWIGQPIPPANRAMYADQPTGRATLVAVDGVRRKVAWAQVPGLGWRVVAGASEDQAMGPYWQARNSALGAMVVLVCLALFWAYRLAASINRPVQQLAHITDQLANGDYTARAVVSGPRELRALAAQFNAMLDVRVKALADLRDIDQRFRDLVDSTDGIVWEADAKTFCFNTISSNAQRLLGYPAEDWLTPGFWASHIHPDDAEATVQYCASCTGRLEDHDFEYRFIAQDGRFVWLRDIVKVIAENGEPRWLRGLMIDITEKKAVADALRTSTDLLEYSQSAAKVGGWELTVATGHLFWTAETYNIHQANPLEFNPTVDAGVSYFLPESREQITQALDQAIGQGLGYALELQTYTTKGNLIDVYTTCTVSLKDGKPYKLTGIFQDVTAQKTALRALQRSQSELESVIGNAMDAIINLDADHKISLFNPAAEKMFGYHADDMLGQPLDRLIPTRFVRAHDAHIDGFSATQTRSRVMGRAGEIKALRANGEEFFIEPSISQMRIGNEKMFTVMMRDISDRVHANAKLKAMNLELVRSNADLEQFAYVASHDLQEPLRSVSSSVQLLKRRYHDALDDRANEFIAHAVGGVQRMQAVIDDLLAYSRVASGPRVMKAADLEGVFQVALENLQLSLTASQATITHDPLPTLRANPLHIGQLFQNLIGNALKFRGDAPAVVHVGAVNLGTEWQFSVADQGIGIAPEYFERIFKLFQRLHTRTEYDGTGIGLTICQKIVERHGGRIWVEPNLGQGCTFFFTLPVAEGSA